MLPKEIADLMQKGICPTCKIPMRKKNGKETHSRAKAILCEERLREKLKKLGKPIERSTITIGGREFEVDAQIVSLMEAKRLKKLQ